MMGSPPPVAVPPLPPPPLPSFSMGEEQPQRGEDYDLLGWARSLSVSPRLYPTSYNASSLSSSMGMGMGLEGGNMPSTFGSYRGLGDASPLLGPQGVSRKDSLTVGTGLSPLLGPTHMGGGSVWGLGGVSAGMGGSSTMLMASGQGAAFDYSAFGQYHSSSPSLDHQPSSRPQEPTRRRSQPSVTQSYSNIDQDRSMSPQTLPPPLSSHSPLIPAAALSASSQQQLPSAASTPRDEHDVTMATSEASDVEEEEDPRIRAYAKLEFPTFDIYIQKLSVVVGRRPAAPKEAVPSVPAPPASAQTPSSNRAESESRPDGEVKLEDFVMMGIEEEVKKEEEPQVKNEVADGIILEVKKEELALPHLSLTPSSQAPSPAGDDDPFSEFLRSSPPPPVLAVTSQPLDLPSVPLPPPDSNRPTDAETKDLLDLLSLAVEESKEAAEAARRPTETVSPPAPAEPSPVPPETPVAPAAAPQVDAANLTDIDLGPIRAVSRQHARLYFDYELGQWAIEVLGRNGVVVEGTWKAKGEREGLGKRTKIQIAERIFYFVLPTIDPPPVTLPPVEEASDSDSDDGVRREEDYESSSLSEVSESGIELSPLLQPVVAPSPQWAPPPSLPSPRKPDPQPMASTSASILALAPPARAAARGINYRPTSGKSGKSGKRLEVLQAARKGPGKGKAAGSSSAPGRGKGKMGKGKSVLPAKTPRRHSFGSSHGDDEEEPFDSDSDSSDDDIFLADMPIPRKQPAVPSKAPSKKPAKKPKEKQEAQKIILKIPHQVPQKQPKRQLLVPRPARASSPVKASPIASTSTLPPLPALPTTAAPRLPSLPPSPDLAVLPPLPPITQTPSALPVASFGSTPFLPTPPQAPTPLLVPRAPVPYVPTLAQSGIVPAPGPPVTKTPAAPVAGPSKPPTAWAPGLPLLPGAPGTPGGPPVKRGRGRPPKNGICAQRPRKPKPDANGVLPPTAAQIAAYNAAAAEARARHGGYDIDPSLPQGPVPDLLVNGPPIPSGPPPDPTKVAYPKVPDVLPDGERPPLAAPADDLYSKPPYTYASLIAQAVSSAETRKLTLNGIYDWITARWPYFSDNQNGWQNSIRHNLTLSRGFLKIPRREDEIGKGAFWAIDPAQIRNFDGLNFRKKLIKDSASPMPSGPKPAPIHRPAPPPKAAPKPNVSGPSKPVVKKPVAPAARPAGSAPSLSSPLPIVVGPIPDSYVRPVPAASSAAPPDDLTAALLKDPPIVLHEGKLILNPAIFAHLTKEQLDNLQVLAASAALQILQAYVVDHFKEKMRKMAIEKAARAAALVAAGGAAGAKPVVPATASSTPVAAPATGTAVPVVPTPSSATPVVSSAPKAAVASPAPSPSVAVVPPPAKVASVTPPVVPTPAAPKAVVATPLPSVVPAPATVPVVEPVSTKRKLEDVAEPDLEVSAPKIAKLDVEVDIAV